MPKPNLHVPGKGMLKPACLFWTKPVMQIFYGNQYCSVARKEASHGYLPLTLRRQELTDEPWPLPSANNGIGCFYHNLPTHLCCSRHSPSSTISTMQLSVFPGFSIACGGQEAVAERQLQTPYS
mmetsp:Transcript_22914/g.47666  ORF Transcript_22914/g.47666 Transcript_22914/m.47666 type:complete len:124 (+) Transcript_22914:1487-1858(+)